MGRKNRADGEVVLESSLEISWFVQFEASARSGESCTERYSDEHRSAQRRNTQTTKSPAVVAQLVEQLHGKEQVGGSNPPNGSELYEIEL